MNVLGNKFDGISLPNSYGIHVLGRAEIAAPSG